MSTFSEIMEKDLSSRVKEIDKADEWRFLGFFLVFIYFLKYENVACEGQKASKYRSPFLSQALCPV